MHDLWVGVDLFDADDRLIFDDRIQGAKPGAGSAVAKKFIITNEEKVLLLLGKEFLHDDVVPFKDHGRHLGEAVIDSVIEWGFETGIIGSISNETTRQQPLPTRWIPFQDLLGRASVV